MRGITLPGFSAHYLPALPTWQVLINEILASNTAGLKDSSGKASDWLELRNTGSSTEDLGGYVLSDGENSWTIPSGVSIPAGGYQLIFASGKGSKSGDAEVHASFKIGAQDAALSLSDASGNVVSAVPYPTTPTDVSFGVVGSGQTVQASSGAAAAQYAILASPTPGATNSAARTGSPSAAGTTRDPSPRPDGSSAIAIQTSAFPSQSPIAGVDLVYTINYGKEVVVPMRAQSPGSSVYAGSIPASAAAAGTLVRWHVVVRDEAGNEGRDPAPPETTDPQNFGTIVADTSDSTSLPIFELFCADANAPWSTGPESGGQALTGGKGYVDGCSLWFNGTYYDNVSLRRKGSTSLAWPKPKMRVSAGNQGKVFATSAGYKVKSFSLSANWAEPGENTFTREPLVWKTFQEMGVDYLESYQSHVRFNGAYFGRFIYVEDWTPESLKRNGYDTSDIGSLFKSESGEYSNLRWDLPKDQVPFYWGQDEPKADESALLLELTRGLAGAGSKERENYLFDGLNLPKVINYMAAQTLILNQDRCTKNYFVYRDRPSGQWSMLPWDVESGFGIDRGLGGVPAPDYCILACDQWNSPLYCDRNHVQDLTVSTPWTLILSNYSLGTSSGVSTAGRRLLRSDVVDRQLLQAAAASGGALAEIAPNGAAEVGLKLPLNSTVPANAQDDQTLLGTPPTGANGTYNYMLDAVLSFPRTRSMYMRRLRSLMDEFTNGRLEGLVTSFYEQVKEEATRDNAKWGNPGTPLRGYQSLTTEQLPIRKQQLYNTFGVDGPIPLIPDAQPSSYRLNLGSVSGDAGGYVELVNPNDFAIDLSDAKLSGAAEFTFAKGTTVAAGDSVHVAADVGAFVKAKGGAGLYVVGPFSGSIQGPAASVSVQSAGGDSLVG
ncbi:hypothetical protein F751_6432 [Auxenochlorella protothecoides]|uniref:LTD domain-containing protein n=1 Tax=Auxenochlorella protothecoides TaxID=3075 RepID=A0A087SB19_AUXPR|nr:hypothetical protein F751_6432 [Auxenochlorella protothecoides]KFM22923.1 hypothetical protein F751_6432 [Auxenochlorella protothecoides]